MNMSQSYTLIFLASYRTFIKYSRISIIAHQTTVFKQLDVTSSTPSNASCSLPLPSVTMKFIKVKLGEYNSTSHSDNAQPFYLYTSIVNPTNYLKVDDVEAIFAKSKSHNGSSAANNRASKSLSANMPGSFLASWRYTLQTAKGDHFISFEALAEMGKALGWKELMSFVNCSREEILSGKANPMLVKTGVVQVMKQYIEVEDEIQTLQEPTDDVVMQAPDSHGTNGASNEVKIEAEVSC